MKTISTGIKPTGIPHIGNYVGATRPAVAASVDRASRFHFFLTDYHAIGGEAERVARSTLEIAASRLAVGLDQ